MPRIAHHYLLIGKAAQKDHIGLEQPPTFLEKRLGGKIFSQSISPVIPGTTSVLHCTDLTSNWEGGEAGTLPSGPIRTHTRKRSEELISAVTTGHVSIGRPALRF